MSAAGAPGAGPRVVVATHNAHKVQELQRILTGLVPGIELLAYDGPEPVEDGISFEENALIKARAAARHTGLPAIADDSGIAVDILGGSPGIFSARWGGPARDAGENLRLLLWQLSDVPEGHRGAAFCCAAALAVPAAPTAGGGAVRDVAAESVHLARWPGTILLEAAGSGGFGYDPIFRPEGHAVSAAELSPAQKDAESHRTRAFRLLAPDLAALAPSRPAS